MSRRWIRHEAANGRIGWEREGSGWISWGWNPQPPDSPGPVYIDRRESGLLVSLLRKQRREHGLDMETGLPIMPANIAPERVELQKKRLAAQRRMMLNKAFKETYPRASDAERHEWVAQYLSRYSGRFD